MTLSLKNVKLCVEIPTWLVCFYLLILTSLCQVGIFSPLSLIRGVKLLLCERCKVGMKNTELKDVYVCPLCKGVESYEEPKEEEKE